MSNPQAVAKFHIRIAAPDELRSWLYFRGKPVIAGASRKVTPLNVCVDKRNLWGSSTDPIFRGTSDGIQQYYDLLVRPKGQSIIYIFEAMEWEGTSPNPAIDVISTGTALHPSAPMNVYPIGVAVTGSQVNFNVRRALSANLAQHGLLMLVGRDMLVNAV